MIIICIRVAGIWRVARRNKTANTSPRDSLFGFHRFCLNPTAVAVKNKNKNEKNKKIKKLKTIFHTDTHYTLRDCGSNVGFTRINRRETFTAVIVIFILL